MELTRQGLWGRMLLITILLLAVYSNTLKHGFVWDDNDIIVKSPFTQSLGNIPMLFLSEDRTDEKPTGYYRPITYVSFTLDRAIWGLNPVGFNITNLLLHVIASLLFYRVVAALFKWEQLALSAALIFSLHPIVGETVNFHAGGRNTLLSACFALAALLFYTKDKPRAAVACFTLAIFSKEFALLIPAVLVLYDWRIRKGTMRWERYFPYAVATFCYLALRSLSVTSVGLWKTLNIAGKFQLVPKIIVSYLKNMLYPFDLRTMYDVSSQVSWPAFALYSLVVLLLVAAALCWRDRNELVFGIFLFLLFLIPVTNILPLGAAKMADRHAYFPLMGFSIAFAYGICKIRKEVAIGLTALLCLAFLCTDYRRNDYWTDNFSLFSRMITDAPERFIGYQVLGYRYFEMGDFGNAEKYLLAAAKKKDVPFPNLVGDAWAFLEMNKREQALVVLDQAIQLVPDEPEPYVMATRFAQESGRGNLARAYQAKALALDPTAFERMKERAAAACRRGEELMASQNGTLAERFIKDAINLDPGLAAAQLDMGTLVARKGDLAGALGYFAKAAALDPGNPAAHYNLAKAYEGLGKKEQAREEMEKYQKAQPAGK